MIFFFISACACDLDGTIGNDDTCEGGKQIFIVTQKKNAQKHRISYVANKVSTSWTSADIGYRLFDADYPVW